MEHIDLALTLRLSRLAKLTPEDRKTLSDTVSRSARWFQPRQEIMSEGERPHLVHAVVEGWVVSTKQLVDGRRQIVNFLLPGDLCSTNVCLLRTADHGLSALTHARIASIGAADVEAIAAGSPRIAQAFLWNDLSVASIQREWMTSLGQRNAYERIAHLLCELFTRLGVVRMVSRGECALPATQNDLADATGLTPVHVNRTVQQLRQDGLISLHEKRLVVHDLERLADAGLFNPAYLHLNGSR
jgi:CRP-like cAMP-binding protein